ncbi:leucine-rich repeat-containing protein 15-like [Astyanax mexicanus]|uniref:Leucine-rich repeat-containing protein 15-like n=1 Tax=Astyanax mexicanus TaxID=7994 RepID=A0A8T2KXD6_ASTMX|nr:leucine-rich repeat-containing protein 15-like [Astyanax mexicanus]
MHSCLFILLLLLHSLGPCHPILSPCPAGCCCPRPGVLILCESLGLHVLPRSVPLTTSALSVARNRLCNVDNVLRRYSSLQELSLSHNWLDRFPRGLPTSLESLQLGENRITYITTGALRHLGNLTQLDLEDNRIRAIQPGAFLGQGRLKKLSLKGNRLTSLPLHLPSSLMHLDVSANCISALDLASLATLVNLQVLKINSNCLRSVPEQAFDRLPSLRTVELANNLWVCECDIMYLYRWLLTDRLRMATDLVCTAPLHLAHKLLLTLSIMAICPKVLKPSERLAPLNTSVASKVLQETTETTEEDLTPIEELSDALFNETRTLRRSCRNSPMNPNRTLPSGVNRIASQSHFRSNHSSLEGLSYEQCLLLNTTYLVPQSTQMPYSPDPEEDHECVDNGTDLQTARSSTEVPVSLFSPTSEAGIHFVASPRTLTQSSDPVMIGLLSVLCVLTGFLLVTVFLVLRSILWRNQRIAPLPSSLSSQINVSS